jgi:diguanylate cyclase (GGDEF)-like protein
METGVILVVGSVLLCCGCMGLLLVRLSNPFFKGLGWLGGSFAAGALGSAILASPADAPTGASTVAANTLILLAYVFLHACILEITGKKSQPPLLGICLLIAQAFAYPVFHHFHNARQMSLVTLGVMLAVQSLHTVWLLKKSARPGLLAPAWFSALLLTGFAGFNLFRATAVLVLGTPQDPYAPNPLQVPSAIIFLGTGLGLGFGVFWMASVEIRLALEHLANTDPLTGTYNRRSIVALCEKEVQRSLRTGQPFSLVMLDLDHFKRINDSHGHEAGDAALLAVADKLRNTLRDVDVLGRWGGEEFVVLLPAADSGAALFVAQRLRSSIEALSVAALNGEAYPEGVRSAITISLGVATYEGGADNLEALLHRCDEALYQAKAAGRNRVAQPGTGPAPYRERHGLADCQTSAGTFLSPVAPPWPTS